MLFGSILFNELSPISLHLLNEKDLFFQQTTGAYFNVSNGLIIALLALAWIGFFKLVEGKKSKKVID